MYESLKYSCKREFRSSSLKFHHKLGLLGEVAYCDGLLGKLCSFLISDDGKKISGQSIAVDGNTLRAD